MTKMMTQHCLLNLSMSLWHPVLWGTLSQFLFSQQSSVIKTSQIMSAAKENVFVQFGPTQAALGLQPKRKLSKLD